MECVYQFTNIFCFNTYSRLKHISIKLNFIICKLCKPLFSHFLDLQQLTSRLKGLQTKFHITHHFLNGIVSNLHLSNIIVGFSFLKSVLYQSTVRYKETTVQYKETTVHYKETTVHHSFSRSKYFHLLLQRRNKDLSLIG